jgi:CheY-like chemotaxis protein
MPWLFRNPRRNLVAPKSRYCSPHMCAGAGPCQGFTAAWSEQKMAQDRPIQRTLEHGCSSVPLPRGANCEVRRSCLAVTSSESSANTAAPTGIRVLVVDDDPLSSAFQSHLVSLLGHQAQVLTDANAALDVARARGCDLMLLDLGMPQPDGFEVLGQLREYEAARNLAPLPVIAVTGYASESDRLRCLMAGFTDHLAKPIQAGTLSSSIERALGPRGVTAGGASDAERLRATVRRLAAVKPGDRSFTPTVTESFALRSAQLLEALRKAVAGSDLDQLARSAQALKSSAEFLGASRLASMCTDAERAGTDGDWDRARELVMAMDNEHQVVLTLLFESSR